MNTIDITKLTIAEILDLKQQLKRVSIAGPLVQLGRLCGRPPILAYASYCLHNWRRVNPNGGAIALGHPLGMSGARLVTTAAYQLQTSGGRFALCTMCVGVGQGVAAVIERV